MICHGPNCTSTKLVNAHIIAKGFGRLIRAAGLISEFHLRMSVRPDSSSESLIPASYVQILRWYPRAF